MDSFSLDSAFPVISASNLKSSGTTFSDDSTSASKDPAKNFPVEIMELIFKNLTGTELVKIASLVSPAWNNHVMSSNRCMDKVVLKIDLRKFSSPKLMAKRSNLLEGTIRTYRHLVIKGHYRMKYAKTTIDSFAAVKGDWKSVDIEKLIFHSISSLNEFVQILSATVETMTMQFTRTNHHDVWLESSTFDRLTSLSIYEPDETMLKLFSKCSNLSNFDFTGDDNLSLVNAIVRNQKQLKNLLIN